MNSWERFLEDLADDAGLLLKQEIKEMIEAAKNDTEIFLKRQGQKIERYLNQLFNRKISREQFEGYLLDIQALTEMHILQLTLAARVRAQRLVDGISKLIIDRLLALL
jgi:hypothetical protein